jgi:hypothetical protein
MTVLALVVTNALAATVVVTALALVMRHAHRWGGAQQGSGAPPSLAERAPPGAPAPRRRAVAGAGSTATLA